MAMGVFRKRRPEPAAGAESFDRGEIADILAVSMTEVAQANAAAEANFHLDSATSWQWDCDQGIVVFETLAGRVSGSFQVLGSHNAGARSWMAGWFSGSFDASLTSASFAIHELGKQKKIPTLERPLHTIDEDDAFALATVAFGHAEGEYLFRTPSEPAAYLAVSDLHRLDLPSA